MPKKCVRYQSSFKILGWPLLAVACGPDPATGEARGWAKGIVAFGDIATGVIAIGGLAGGGIAVGGLACGLATVGGVALGGLVLAGVAIGGVSFGGVAVGHYAKGGVGVGTYVVSPKRQDPEALRIFGGKTGEEKIDRPPMESEAK